MVDWLITSDVIQITEWRANAKKELSEVLSEVNQISSECVLRISAETTLATVASKKGDMQKPISQSTTGMEEKRDFESLLKIGKPIKTRWKKVQGNQIKRQEVALTKEAFNDMEKLLGIPAEFIKWL